MKNYYLPDNVIFSIGGLQITYYGVLVALGMLFGVLLVCRLAKKRGLKSDDILTLALYVFPLAIIGARIYYCVFSGRSYSFVEFWQFTDGGIAVLGAVIGGAIGGLIYSLIHKKNFIVLFDVVVAGLALGQGIGRIACLFGRCCYGELTMQENLQFFPLSLLIDGEWHYATCLYESLWNFIGMAILLVVFNKFSSKGTATATYLIWYGVGRSLIEGIRGDSLMIGTSGIRVSQLLSIILIVVGITIIAINIIKSKRGKTHG